MKDKQKFFSVLIFFFVTLLIVCLTFLFLEQSIISETTEGYYLAPFSVPMQIMVAGIILTLISIFGSHIISKIRLSFNGILLSCVLIFVFFVSLVNLLTIPDTRNLMVMYLNGTVNNVVLTLSIEHRISAILTLLVSFSFLFFILLALPNHRYFLTIIKFFTFTIVIIAFVAIGHSLLTEWDKYVHIVTIGHEGSGAPVSFFNNRNPYASFLLSAQVMVVFLYYVRKDRFRRYFFYLLQIPLMFGILLTLSKTNIFLSTFLFLIPYLLHLINLLFEKKWWRFMFEFLVSAEIITTLYVFRFNSVVETTQFALFLKRMLPNELTNNDLSTIEGRVRLWQYAYTLMIASPITLLIGDGPHLSRMFYFQRMEQEINMTSGVGFGDYHNGFFEITHSFGLLGLFIYLVLIIVVIGLVLRRGKVNHYLSFFVGLSLVIFLLRSQTESLSLLLFKSEGIMASFTFVLPFLYLMNLSHQHGYGKEFSQPQKKVT